MDLQTSLVNSHLDDLRQTAHEIHAATGPRVSNGRPLGGVRRGLGRWLIGPGLALMGPAADRPVVRMA